MVLNFFVMCFAVLLKHNMHKRGDLRDIGVYSGVSVPQSRTKAFTRPIECIRLGDRDGMAGT